MLNNIWQAIVKWFKREKPVSAEGYDVVKQIKEMAKLGGKLIL